MDLKQMKKDFPELLAEIEETARNDGMKMGTAQGVESERKRVVEILAANADPEVTAKAIADGVEAAAFYKLAYESERAKRGQALREMEAQAPEPQGQEMPADPKKSDPRPADQQLNDAALAIMAAEKIDFSAALRKAYEQNPDLAGKWAVARHAH